MLASMALVGSSGCALIFPDVSHEPVIHNPFPQLSKVAVAPFFNLSDERTVDGRKFALAYFAELQSVPGFGGTSGERVLTAVGLFELGVAVWIVTGYAAIVCAFVQTVVLLSMNIVELRFARRLLLWPAGLIPVNLLFLSLAWIVAVTR